MNRRSLKCWGARIYIEHARRGHQSATTVSVPHTSAGVLSLVSVLAFTSTGCIGSAPPPTPSQTAQLAPSLPPPIPAGGGWGLPVTALTRTARDGGLWAGTNGDGLWVLPENDGSWEQVTGPGAPAGDATVNAVAVDGDNVWYGTVGGGFGMSSDGGETWRAWTAADVGGRWAYVAPEGIQARRGRAWIATLGGLRMTSDGGETWRCIDVAGTSAPSARGCDETVASLSNSYLLTLDVDLDRTIWVGHLEGVSVSADAGATWRELGSDQGLPRERIRHIAIEGDSIAQVVWVATEGQIFVDSTRNDRFKPAAIRVPGSGVRLPGAIRSIVPAPGFTGPTILVSRGMVVGSGGGAYRVVYLAGGERYRPVADMWTMAWWGPPLWPIGASSVGLNRVYAGGLPPDVDRMRGLPDVVARPVEQARPWLASPVEAPANPYPDALHPFGGGSDGAARTWASFNEPAGANVLAVGAGEVIEAASDRLVIRLDATASGRSVFAVYSGIESNVQGGTRVVTRNLLGRVARSTDEAPDQLRIEIRIAPGPDQFAASEPVNPVLWIQPTPRTGVVLGRVVNAAGEPVSNVPVRGFIVDYPEETPFAGSWTYMPGVSSDPDYDETFATAGIPVGDYVVGAVVDGRPLWRRVVVADGQITRVDFER